VFYATHLLQRPVPAGDRAVQPQGQTRKMTIARIAAHPLEWAIYKMVDTRKISQESILALYKMPLHDMEYIMLGRRGR